MTWLVKLYPPRWRRRYGKELTDLIAPQSFSFGTAADLIAGAIDAWLHPEFANVPAIGDETPAPSAKGATMLARMMQLKCAGCGPKITSADVGKSLAVVVGGTIALLALIWQIRSRFEIGPYVESQLVNAFLVPQVVSLRYTSLKGRSAAVQAVFIGGLVVFLFVVSLVAAWL